MGRDKNKLELGQSIGTIYVSCTEKQPFYYRHQPDAPKELITKLGIPENQPFGEPIPKELHRPIFSLLLRESNSNQPFLWLARHSSKLGFGADTHQHIAQQLGLPVVDHDPTAPPSMASYKIYGKVGVITGTNPANFNDDLSKAQGNPTGKDVEVRKSNPLSSLWNTLLNSVGLGK